MSYCRFSSGNWWSDVYVYQSTDGWITHVAGMRGVTRPVPDIISCSFSDATPGDCANRLEYLRALGYRVPQHAIDALREESCE